MPGVLPVINRQAVEFAAMTALALNCTVQEMNVFARKSYFYPDLPKNYQISQYDLPLSRDGWLVAEDAAGPERIGVRRVHLEEDTAKLTHVEAGGDYSLIDFNRSGMPLMEIVSEPDMHSPDEVTATSPSCARSCASWASARAIWKKGPCASRPTSRCAPEGSHHARQPLEVKNLNSFRAVLRSWNTRSSARRPSWTAAARRARDDGLGRRRNVTVTQRSKEEAHDYRYFPEPDLPPLS